MTIEELKVMAGDAHDRVKRLGVFLKIDARREEKRGIEAKMSAADFWDHKEEAQNIVGALSACRNVIEPYEKLQAEADDFNIMLELAEEDPEIVQEADALWQDFEKKLNKLELMSFLSGKFDANNMYITIHAGAGGTESCDWASMLLRMYRRWFELRGWKDEVIDLQPGEEAGVKSVTLHVMGEYAFGNAKCERGIHRLVRISPFDSNARRHTSFASVDVMPELDDDIDVDINEADLRIDTYRSSGAGGQHVNTTDSAVRITHLPSGIVVCCQNERSQHKNRATAMKMLKGRLYEMEDEKRRAEANAHRDERGDNGWGNQIRSYVLQPYQMVKDLRTGVETGNTAAVLDGEIDEFIEAYLRGVRRE
ncbi:MAG: peptide chain release factor 2 [Lentisphaeria bacterium]|nr:peptide chain release factor 2 [Lentisphaeria bacterium]